MKIAFKNFVMTLRRYKTASVLNIAGLTLAFTAFYVIMAQVRYEMSFNRSIADNERVYMLRPQWGDDAYASNAPRMASEQAMAASPDVEAGGVMKGNKIARNVWVKRNGYNMEKFDVGMYMMSASMVDVMSFRTVAGDLHDMAKPATVIISRRTAERLGVGVGDDVYMQNIDDRDSELRPDVRMTVAGVFEDFADNTMLRGHDMFIDAGDRDASSNNNWNFSIFVKLREGADPAAFESVWEGIYWDYNRDMNEKYGWGESDEKLFLDLKMQSLRDQYYSPITERWGYVEQGSATATATLFGIAVLIVVIAFINFVNFFFALIPVRLRAVNICKVFGAPTSSLRWNFVFEAVGLVVCSLVLAMYLMLAVQDSFLAGYVKCSLALTDNLPTVGLVLAVVVVMALAAALYPAWYITSFNASLAAKGGFAGSAAGRRLRTMLVGVQFAVSMILIVLAFSFWLQYRFMINYDLGFDRENILTFEISGAVAKRGEAFRSHLAGHPDIEGVTASGSSIIGMSSSWGRKYDDRDITMYVWSVIGNSFFEVMGIPILEGDGFTEGAADRQDFMIGRYFQRDIGAKVGDDVTGNTVVGVFADLRLLSLAESDGNVYVVFTCGLDKWMSNVYVRTRAGADIPRVCDFVRKSVVEFDPNSDEPSVEFLDRGVQRLYGSTKLQMVVISLFALLAVVISLMGVFGMVLFDTQHRRREIAVRKVFGASTSGIVSMLNRRYVIIVSICFAVAGPVAWYIAKQWLAGFATRIELSWWIFAVSFLAVFLITVGLVTLRSRRAAGENPSRVLGGE